MARKSRGTEDLLTPLERRFVMELIKDGNKAAAAERAGCKGSKTSFNRLGHQMFVRPHVKRAYDQLQVKSLERAMITRETLQNQIQDTIMEARQAKKFDAAFKGYAQLGEMLGVLGKDKKKAGDDEDMEQLKTNPFISMNDNSSDEGDEDMHLNDDLSKFLKNFKPSSEEPKN